MLESVENITFNGINLAEEFTDEESGAYFIVNDVRGREVLGLENRHILIPGRDGAYMAGTRTPIRYLDVDITMKGTSFEDLRKRIELLSDILNTGNESVPIQFADETDRTYYGKFDNAALLVEKARIYQSTLSFICVDPYKYGPEKVATLPSDIVTVHNEGSADAFPIIELEATKPVTFASISVGEMDDSEYNLIGEPADDDVEIVDSKTKLLELTSDMDGWGTAGTKVDRISGAITDGTIIHDGTGLIASDYGSPPSGEDGYGPAIIRELPEAAEDFEIETIIDTRTNTINQNFRVELYGFDENMNMIGKIGISDVNRSYHERRGLARIGDYVDSTTRYLIHSENFRFINSGPALTFYIRWKREGRMFEVNIYRIVNGELRNWVRRRYTDASGDWLGNLKFIQAYIRTYRDRPNPTLARVNRLDVYKLSQASVNQTPYILYPGDVISFNHELDDILINGEPRMELKDFGGSFFTLKRGTNLLTVTPEDSFNAEIRYRERYV